MGLDDFLAVFSLLILDFLRTDANKDFGREAFDAAAMDPASEAVHFSVLSVLVW